MKKMKKRILAMVLLATMMFSSLPVSTTSAMEGESTSKPKVTQLDAGNAIKSENRLNYIFVESPYLEAPATQNIVVSWGDGTEQIKDMRLTVQKEDGVTEEWTCSKQSQYLYLFSKEYADENEESTYKVTEIRFVENGKERQFFLDDLETETEFGVNKAYDGIEELKPLVPEDVDAVESSIVTIDENGEAKVQKDIASALNTVSEEMGVTSRARSAERAGEIVVALDPGHDDKHGGTSGSGLTEKDLVLKIANYAKAELETYQGVKVYMTRTTASCPYPGNKNSGGCIKDRVQASARAGAKIFVSLHLNSGPANANGAEIIIPNSSWKPQLETQGKELAEKILNELVTVGINKRPIPIYSKDTTVGETYPDGSKSDYFAVQIYAKEAGIPGIIVEHAFLSNAHDVNTFLTTEAGLKKLGVADATGIAKYLKLSKKGPGKWVQFGDKWKYEVNGKYLVEEWAEINGYRYYFDEEGYRTTGWLDVEGYTYYFNSSGKMLKGFNSLGGYTYYFNSSGKMLKGFNSLGGHTYYFNSSGKMLKGFNSLGGYMYYFNSSGKMLTGFNSLGGYTYYFNSSGKMLTGFNSLGGYTYYFDGSGKMLTGFNSLGGYTYYFNSSGKMLKGFNSLGGYTYYFNSSGKMLTGFNSLGGYTYYFNSSGKMLKGFNSLGGYTYYFNSSGKMLTGFNSLGGATYYFDGSGKMQVDWTNIDGVWYYFDANGKYISNPSENSPLKPQTLIEGTTSVTALKLANFFKRKGAKYPKFYKNSDAPTLERFCEIYVEEAKAENIKAEVVFVQSMLETGWLKYGGDVKIEQYNFAGIGTIGGGAAGASFKNVREGVRAQVQHLKAYANNLPLNNPQVDPRFHLVKRGTAKYVEWLGQRENPKGYGWATGKTYGYRILRLIKEL